MDRLKARLRKMYAAALLRLYRLRIRFQHWRQRHGLKFASIVLLAIVTASVLSLPFLQRFAGDFFRSPESLAALRSLLGGTGTALIGAAAIAFSLIVFAMQTNVERMPHGLFRQLSSDRWLLWSFLGSFLTAIVVASTSLVPDGSWGVPAIVIALWGIAVTLLLFLVAYRRALKLINPIEQLAIMSRVARRDLQRWGRLADRAAIVLQEAPLPAVAEADIEIPFDRPKAHFFQVNAFWSAPAQQAIHYAVSYAKRFAEQGDYEVTDAAFNRMMLINASYCAAKRGTFVASSPFVDVPGVADSFINTTLEQLRQTMQTALAKGDERLAGCTLRAIAGLYGVYLGIEYSGRAPSKYHALLASGYLSASVESVAPHDMPDLMMEGIRLMGRASIIALDHVEPSEVLSMAKKISVLSSVGVLKVSHRPVTLTAFEQMAEITFELLTRGRGDVRFPLRELRSAVVEAAKEFLVTPDTPLSSMHQNTLGPYFSSASFSSLRSKLTTLTNQLVTLPEGHTRAGEIIGNVETWADQMYEPHKQLLLMAIERRSFFAFDALHWAIGISDLLLVLSNASACSEHDSENLRRHAIWLVSTLSWIPDDREAVRFVENFSFTQSLFEAALNGRQRECAEFYDICKELLLSWALKAGKHETGWGTLETAVKGLVALVILEGTQEAITALETELRAQLAREGAPSMELRTRSAINLTRSANSARRYDGFGSIDRVLAEQDQGAVRRLLLAMAAIVAGEPPA